MEQFIFAVLPSLTLAVLFFIGFKVFQRRLHRKEKEDLLLHRKEKEDLLGKNAILRNEIEDLRLQKETKDNQIKVHEQTIKSMTKSKKGSEVKTGRIVEQMAPFLDGFPYVPSKAKFVGQPIDFIVFDEKGVHLIEVKSGDSKLSPAQRRIKKQVEEGKVTFETFRIQGT